MGASLRNESRPLFCGIAPNLCPPRAPQPEIKSPPRHGHGLCLAVAVPVALALAGGGPEAWGRPTAAERRKEQQARTERISGKAGLAAQLALAPPCKL